MRLGVGVHQEVSDEIRIVAGVVGEDVRRQVMFRLGTTLVPEDGGERSRQPGSYGTQGIEPRTDKNRIDRHQRPSHLVAFCLPLRVVWIVARQGTGAG